MRCTMSQQPVCETTCSSETVRGLTLKCLEKRMMTRRVEEWEAAWAMADSRKRGGARLGRVARRRDAMAWELLSLVICAFVIESRRSLLWLNETRSPCHCPQRMLAVFSHRPRSSGRRNHLSTPPLRPRTFPLVNYPMMRAASTRASQIHSWPLSRELSRAGNRCFLVQASTPHLRDIPCPGILRYHPRGW